MLTYTKFLICTFILLTAHLSYAQTTIKGNVMNLKKESVPFVNIGIKKKNIGTAADGKGSFTLRLGTEYSDDTLTFSAVGYQELSIPITAILADKQSEFIIEEKTTSLQEVVISSKALKTRKFGTTSRNPLISGTAQTRGSDDISELAKLIKLNGKESEVLAVTLYLKSWEIDSANFRVNFYESVNGIPGQRIVEKSIIRRLSLDKGWTTVNLEQYGIYVDKDFFISFEYLPDPSHNEKYLFIYGGALGGSSLSRQVSLGTWKKEHGATMAAYITVRQ